MLNPIQKIAIHRLKNEDKKEVLIRWWTKRYNLPSNHPLLLDLTWEELYLEWLLETYSGDASLMEADIRKAEGTEWNGETSKEHEEEIRKKLQKVEHVDLTKWQTEVVEGSDEFDDDFEGELDGKKND